MSYSRSFYLWPLACLFLINLLGGCDNTLHPLNRDKGIYSVYGALNINSDTNYVRVKNLNIPLVDDTTRTLNATVTLENLSTGQSQQLTDSIVTYDGVFTHNFITTLAITPKTEYRVTAQRRSDNRKVTANTVTPIISDVTVEPRGGDCSTSHKVSFHPVSPEGGIQTTITFKYNSKTFHFDKPALKSNNQQLIVQYFQPDILICNLIAPAACKLPDISPCDGLTTGRFTVFYTHYGPGFQTKATSDSINIPNGTGHFIGLYRDSTFFTAPHGN